MGTRHLIVLAHEGKNKVALFCNHDGQPSGHGLGVLQFLRGTFDRAKMTAALKFPYVAKGLMMRAILLKNGATADEIDSALIPKEVYESVARNIPTLSDDIGFRVLDMVQNATAPVPMFDGMQRLEFVHFAYVVDLDRGSFEIHTRLDAPLGVLVDARFPRAPDMLLAASWPLDALPSDAAFLAQIDKFGV